MKQILTVLMIPLLLCGCANISPMGKDTYLSSRRGTAWSTIGSLKAKCLKDADRFCKKNGLAMVPVSTAGRNGGFGVMGSCEVVFLAVPPNDPRNVPPDVIRDSDSTIEYRQRKVGDKP